MKKFIPLLVLILITLIHLPACQKEKNGDQNNPYIILNPPNPQYWPLGESYVDPGAEAFDITESGDTLNITAQLQTSDNINVDIAGDYQVFYNVSDESGNNADQQTRDVRVLLTK